MPPSEQQLHECKGNAANDAVRGKHQAQNMIDMLKAQSQASIEDVQVLKIVSEVNQSGIYPTDLIYRDDPADVQHGSRRHA